MKVNMMTLLKIVCLSAPALLCACASVMDPSASAHQAIQVNSTPPGAACTLSNDKGTYNLTTPGSITIAKTDWPGLLGNQLVVSCSKGALKGDDHFSSLPRGFGWFSVAGGGASAFADLQTGYGYPDVITIPLH